MLRYIYNPDNYKMKTALITGITGQDGSYLAEFLLDIGYQVWGIIRRSSTFNDERIEHLYHKKNKELILRYGDLTDAIGLQGVLFDIKSANPEILEVYNLGAMSHVKVSFELPEYAGNVDGMGTLRLLEAIRNCGLMPITRFYQASTSEMYGKVREIPQTELTPFHPRSPYGVAKLYSYWIVKNYRESYDFHASNGILFNHESERRGVTFVTRKITVGLAKILAGKEEFITLGNIDAQRDWGHAYDYVRGMWKMLQQDTPDDYVLATNQAVSVRSFIEKCFASQGITIKWRGKDAEEVGYCADTNKVYIKISPRYYRPAEVDYLRGDPKKAKEKLGWEPQISFDELCQRMVDYDLAVFGIKSKQKPLPKLSAREYNTINKLYS